MNTLYKLYQAILWTELWVVAAAVLAGMFWSPALIVAPLVGLGFAFLRLGVEKRLPGPTPTDPAILLFALLLPFNYALAAVPEQTLQPILRILGGIALYYAAVNWCRTVVHLRWLDAATGVIALGLCLLSLISVNWTSGKLFFIPTSVYERFSIYVADTIHPNVLGGSLIAIIPLTLAIPLFAWRNSSWLERLLYPMIFVVAFVALLLTQSRGALLALFAALLVVLVLRSRWFWSLPVLGLMTVAAAYKILGPADLNLQVVDLISIEGFSQRADIWQRTLFMIQDFPLTGVGLGHFSDAFRIFYPMSLDPTSLMPHAHNIYLQVAADLGIPGLVMWLGVLLAALAAAWHVYRAGKRLQQPMISAIGAGLLGCQLAIIFHGLFDSVLWGQIRIAPLVWWLWGLSMAALNVVNQPSMNKIEHHAKPFIYPDLMDDIERIPQ